LEKEYNIMGLYKNTIGDSLRDVLKKYEYAENTKFTKEQIYSDVQLVFDAHDLNELRYKVIFKPYLTIKGIGLVDQYAMLGIWLEDQDQN